MPFGDSFTRNVNLIRVNVQFKKKSEKKKSENRQCLKNALCVLHFDLKMMALNMRAQGTLLNQNIASGCCMNSSCSWKYVFLPEA